MDKYLKLLKLPEESSHKGQNGRLLIIGGSHLFHSASLWALKVASRIVDLVHYSSVAENNKIVQKLKEEFRDGIVISRSEIESYIQEDDCILIGPGMVRSEAAQVQSLKWAPSGQVQSLREIESIKDEGMQTYYLTKYLLQKYPKKRWVIDAGALQMLDPNWVPPQSILTPHHREFEGLEFRIQNSEFRIKLKNLELKDQVKLFAQKYNCIVLLKGEKDIVASTDKLEIIEGGNAGMTKGGTGDVLAGLVAALYCKNDAFTSVVAASYINKKAGEDLYSKKGFWFNASDLADQIPETMKKLVL
jgi:NAD(P)H-hydrate epimerase